MKEDIKKDEESLEEILEELTEEELDKKLEEMLKEDILSEEEVKMKFTHMNTALVENTVSTLKDKNMMPLENLEEKLIEDKEDENELIPREIVEYEITEEERLKNHYTKPEMENISYNANRNLSTEFNLKSSHGEIQKNINSISSEMEFVRKSMKSKYISPKEFIIGEEKKENNRLIQDFRKLSDDYKTG